MDLNDTDTDSGGVTVFDPATDPRTAAAYAKAQAALSAPPVSAAGKAPPVDWRRAFDSVLMNGAAFAAQDVSARTSLLGAFMRESDLGFIYAPRGTGKTWEAMLMAGAVAAGEALGEWEAGSAGPVKVCYVDGEVNMADSIERARLVKLPESVHWIHHEAVSETTGCGINLADPVQQEALLQTMLAAQIRVLFLDNLSCVFRGMAENEADAWELVLPWLLKLRRHQITVVLVAHAGRNGEMRGTSRREDAAHWILRLEDAGEGESRGMGFKSRFTKNRNARDANVTCPPLKWRLETVDGSFRCAASATATWTRSLDLVRDGMTGAGEIAKELGVSAATVSRWAKRAESTGAIVIDGRTYRPARNP